jgi:hypothetical protein
MHMRLVTAGVLAAAVLLGAADGSHARQQPRLPERLADSTYWRIISEFSEPSGFFLSENFVSNETEWQTVIPSALQIVPKGSVYLGVGPEQNFTYIAALKPRIAFITDIRRQNLVQHLLYKAIFELSNDRGDFLSRLFSRNRPGGLDSATDAAALVTAFAGTKPDTAYYSLNQSAILDYLVNRRGFALTSEDSSTLKAVYSVFFTMGPDISYSSTSRTRPNPSSVPMVFMGPDSVQRVVTYRVSLGGGFATFASLLTENDGTGLNRGWLATEANYRWLREFQLKNLLVPIVGDFAGPKALRAIGAYLSSRGERIGAFYVSNVEQYLFQNGVDSRFYANVGTLPIDSASQFIRSFPNAFRALQLGRPAARLAQTLSPIGSILEMYRAGRIRTYLELQSIGRP